MTENPVLKLQNIGNRNRANAQGEWLEAFIKGIFCRNLTQNAKQQANLYQQHFSYIGSSNHPPDAILRNGDALEIKKAENRKVWSAMHLNSSHPKDKLYADDARLTAKCRDCEKQSWVNKDLIYLLGMVERNQLINLWAIYGDCWFADRTVYEKIEQSIKKKINQSPTLSSSKTKELGRINNIDPLQIAHLRVRGMWMIDRPTQIFDHLIDTTRFNVHAIMLNEKYQSFPASDRSALEKCPQVVIQDINLKSPNRPSKLLKAKLIEGRYDA